MDKYLDINGVPKSLEIKIFNNLNELQSNKISESMLYFNKINEAWLKKIGWEVYYNFDGDLNWYDVASLIRFCGKNKVKNILSIPVQFLIQKEMKFLNARVFCASWRGFSQALWGVHDAKEITPMFDLLYKLSLEPFVMIPNNENLNFYLMRELGQGLLLAGPRDFLEYIVSRSKSNWYIGGSLEISTSDRKLVPSKNRKDFIRLEKLAIQENLSKNTSSG